MDVLALNHYDSTRRSVFLAGRALQRRRLVFSQVDAYDGYEAALVGAEVNYGL